MIDIIKNGKTRVEKYQQKIYYYIVETHERKDNIDICLPHLVFNRELMVTIIILLRF